MLDFKGEVNEFLERLVAQENASGFADEIVRCLPALGDGPEDLSDNEFVMKYVAAYFGADTISLKAIAVEKEATAPGDHNFVIELAKKTSSDALLVKISIENDPEDMRCDLFCTNFLGYEFVQAVDYAFDYLFVTSHFPDDTRNSLRAEMIHREDLELFIKDMVLRHVDPGVDPITKVKQAYLERITAAEAKVEENAWYSGRRLGQFPDHKAPRRLVPGRSRTVWLHPDYAAR